MANVPDLQANEVSAAKLAVDAQVEEGQLTHPVFDLKSNSECPDVLELELERRILRRPSCLCSMARDEMRWPRIP